MLLVVAAVVAEFHLLLLLSLLLFSCHNVCIDLAGRERVEWTLQKAGLVLVTAVRMSGVTRTRPAFCRIHKSVCKKCFQFVF